MTPEQVDLYRPLLHGFLNGELDRKQTADVNDALRRSAILRSEFEQLRVSSGKLNTPSSVEPAAPTTDQLSNTSLQRLLPLAGVWLILGGYLAIILYALYESWTEDGFNVPNTAVTAIFLAATALLVAITRRRLMTATTDPYKDIQR